MRTKLSVLLTRGTVGVSRLKLGTTYIRIAAGIRGGLFVPGALWYHLAPFLHP